MDNIEQLVKIVETAGTIIGAILVFVSFVGLKNIAITLLPFEKRGKIYVSKLFVIFAVFFLLCFFGGVIINSAYDKKMDTNDISVTSNEAIQNQDIAENEANKAGKKQTDDGKIVCVETILVLFISLLVSIVEAKCAKKINKKMNEYVALYTKGKYIVFGFLVFWGIGLIEFNMVLASNYSSDKYNWQNPGISFLSALFLTLAVSYLSKGYEYKAYYKLRDEKEGDKYIFAREGDLFVVGTHPYIDHCKEFKMMKSDDICSATLLDSTNQYDVFWDINNIHFMNYDKSSIDDKKKMEIYKRIAMDLSEREERLYVNDKLFIEYNYIKDKIVYRINRKKSRVISEEVDATSEWNGRIFFTNDEKNTSKKKRIKKKKESVWTKSRRRRFVYFSDDTISKDIFDSEVNEIASQYVDIRLENYRDKPIVRGYLELKKNKRKKLFEIDFSDFGHITGEKWIKEYRDYDKTQEIADAIQTNIHSILSV